MANPTKIFLSSAADPDLQSLRDQLFDQLSDLGHNPLRYENNFGPWTLNTVETCLKRVEESDILLLFVSNRAGSYIEAEDRTVTHLEFHRAFVQDKKTVVFVHTSIKDFFFHNLYSKIHQSLENHVKKHQSQPESVFKKIVLPLCETMDCPENVDPYIWFFLFDLTEKQIYLEDLNLESPAHLFQLIQDYLSDFLRQGLFYLRNEAKIQGTMQTVSRTTKFEKAALDLTELLQGSSISNWQRFLAILQHYTSGDDIFHRKGTYSEQQLGSFGYCTGITCYRENDNQMNLVERVGVTGYRPSFPLEDTDSFVVDTYRSPDQEKVYYDAKKKQLYFTMNVQDFVLCFHFPLEGNWDNEKIQMYFNDIKYAIINAETQTLRTLAAHLLGGIRDESKKDI